MPFNKIEVIVNGKVAAHDEIAAGDTAGLRVRRLDVELPIGRSSWIALRGARSRPSPRLRRARLGSHESGLRQGRRPKIASRKDAEYFVDWIEQMLRVVAARNRYASVEDRRQVETLFRRAQDEFRKMVETDRGPQLV